jgi:hypothetical protein
MAIQWMINTSRQKAASLAFSSLIWTNQSNHQKAQTVTPQEAKRNLYFRYSIAAPKKTPSSFRPAKNLKSSQTSHLLIRKKF